MQQGTSSRKSSLLKTNSSRKGVNFDGASEVESPRPTKSRATTPIGRRNRRVATIDPNTKITDVSRMPKSSSKVVVPERDKIFNFRCEGTIGGDSQLNGKRVEWRATFDRPVEQFIYPSLQRYDVETYEEKVKKHEQMHGKKHLINYVSPVNSPRSLPPSLSPRSPIVKYQESLNRIKLEPLPDELLPPFNENIMYIHAPKWSLRLMGEDTKQETVNPQGYTSTIEEINVEGERYLKQQIKEHYANIEKERLERERLGSAGFNIRRRAIGHIEVGPNLDSANGLVSGLSRANKHIRLSYVRLIVAFSRWFCDWFMYGPQYSGLKKRGRQTELQAAVQVHAKQPLNASESMVFNRLRRDLMKTVPNTHRHLLDGIHYYKVSTIHP